MRAQRGELGLAEPHGALGRPVEPADHVEAARLARPVGPDQGVDRAGLDGELHRVQRGDAAEAQRDAVDDERRYPVHRDSSRRGRCACASSRLGVGLRLRLGVSAQVEPLHVLARGQLGGGPRERDPADLEHRGVVGHRQRHRGVLLDEHDRGALRVDLADHPADARDHLRGEPERRLVEQQQARARHEGAADREHLLLAAGQQARPLARALGEHGEQLVHPLAGPPCAPRRDRAPRPPARRFSSTVMPGEDLPALGHGDDAAADDQRRVEPVDAVAVEGDLARGHRAPVQPEGARHRAQERGLARAVAAEHREHAVSGDGDGDVLQRADRASVPHRQPADLEHAAVRRHAVHHTALDSPAQRGGNQTDTTPLSAAAHGRRDR